ncbi:DUF5131 family protein [Agrobacterium sp. RC10-4-1]|uniref:DUF5131 family protein n=1 Tax=Agrobacterium sp. RC10-4-1 TaxID=2587039 RepID=UPI0015FE2A5D|nr:DUF5131 family protein [Agrobacterium sp. RC10-4-1]
MADTTNISWADMTFNPWIGCTRIAPACDGCYAAHMMETRMHRAEWGGPGKGNGTRVRTKDANWRKPLAWNAKAAKEGTRPFVFCASLADVFDNAVPEEWRRDLFDLIRATPHLVWLLLTKRPQNIAKMAEKAGGLPENAAIGTTAEDQPRANINVPALLQASADLRRANTRPLFLFLSCEPLIGPIDLISSLGGTQWVGGQRGCDGYHRHNGRPGEIIHGVQHDCNPNHPHHHHDERCNAGIDWVIAGGETDQGEHKARPAHPDWLRDLRDQCAEAGVAFHFKQWGEYVPQFGSVTLDDDPEISRYDWMEWTGEEWEHWHKPMWCDELDADHSMIRAGKHKTGRFLDSIEHNARPAVPALTLKTTAP